MEIRVIVDVDCGIDDIHALLILLHAEKIKKIKIEAICCSMGNSTVDNVSKNLIRVLEIVKRTDIPIYKGCSQQLILPEHPIPSFHGTDGLGDLVHEKDPDLSIIRKKHSALAMAEIAENNPREITLLCIGPLTNVAIAMRMFENFEKNLKEIYLMGGNYTAVGNVTSTAEYNFYVDPEAAYIVLETATCPIYIFPWETCLNCNNKSLSWRWEVLGKINNPIVEFVNKAEKSIYSKHPKIVVWQPCDAYLALAFILPEIIKKQKKHRVTVELNGSKTRGQIVLDHLQTQKPNAVVIEEIDGEFFKNYILEVYKSFT